MKVDLKKYSKKLVWVVFSLSMGNFMVEIMNHEYDFINFNHTILYINTSINLSND